MSTANVRIVEAYKVGSAVEAQCARVALDEAGIAFQIVGDQLAASYGMAGSWNMPSILVAERDVERARAILAERLGHNLAPPASVPKLRYGLAALLVNLTAVATILGLYRPLGPLWPSLAYGAFLLLVVANFAAVVRASARRPLERVALSGGRRYRVSQRFPEGKEATYFEELP